MVDLVIDMISMDLDPANKKVVEDERQHIVSVIDNQRKAEQDAKKLAKLQSRSSENTENEWGTSLETKVQPPSRGQNKIAAEATPTTNHQYRYRYQNQNHLPT